MLRRAAAAGRSFSAEAAGRSFSAEAAGRSFSAEAAPVEPAAKSARKGSGSLGRRLLSLVYPKRSAVIALNRWVEEGRSVQKYQLNRVVRELRTFKRYKLALEICEWMRTKENIKLLPGDYALHLDLVYKIRGLASAEKFLEDLPDAMIKGETCTALLHAYIQQNSVAKAEALMQKMTECGFLKNPLPYNLMLKMFVSNGESEKVTPLLHEMEKTTSPDVFTYNILLGNCIDRSNAEAAEKILITMEKRKIDGDWVTYSTLANIYTTAGHLDKAKDTLREMEKRVSGKVRVGFASLITSYANISDKNGIYRVWKKMESTFRKMNDVEYLRIISSLVKLGDVEGAENIYGHWESVSGSRNPLVPNALLLGYIKDDSMHRAERFLQRMEEKGFLCSYVTWETMALGYLRVKKIQKSVDCLKKGLSNLKKWEPNEKIIKEVYNELETRGDIKCAEEFLAILRKAGYVATDIYNALLRTYANAGQMPLLIVERMKKDKLSLDEETHRLIELTSKLCVGEIPDVLY